MLTYLLEYLSVCLSVKIINRKSIVAYFRRLSHGWALDATKPWILLLVNLGLFLDGQWMLLTHGSTASTVHLLLNNIHCPSKWILLSLGWAIKPWMLLSLGADVV